MPTKKQHRTPQGDPAPEGATESPPVPRPQTKLGLLRELIAGQGGATLEDLTSATGWLQHTVRAAITGLRKRGHDVQRERADGVSRYVIASERQ